MTNGIAARLSLFSSVLIVLYPKLVKEFPESVLRETAGFQQISMLFVPLFQPIIIEHLNTLVNNEWRDIPPQALFEHDKPTYTSVSVLERMYRFKPLMKPDNILKTYCSFALVGLQ